MNPWKGLIGLPREMWIIAFSVLINRMGTMVLPFLVIYLTTRIGLKAGAAGFIITCYGLGGLISAPFVGRLADRIGSFLLMKISLFFTAFVLSLYPLFTGYTQIMAVTFVWAVISEAFRPASLSLVSEIVPVAQRKTAFALNRLMINLGMSIGPVAAGFLIQYSFSIIFYVDALTSLMAFGFLMLLPVKIHKGHEGITQILPENVNALKDRRFIYFLLAVLPAVMAMFQHLGGMPIFLSMDLKYSTSTIGLLFTVNTILIILIEVPLNSAISGWPYKRALPIAAVLIASGFGAMAYTRDLFSVILSIVIWTFGEMLLFPASSAYISEIAPPEKRGEYMGYYQMIFSLAFTLGPWLGTKVFEVYGARILWCAVFLISIVSALLMLKLKQPVSAALPEPAENRN